MPASVLAVYPQPSAPDVPTVYCWLTADTVMKYSTLLVPTREYCVSIGKGVVVIGSVHSQNVEGQA